MATKQQVIYESKLMTASEFVNAYSKALEQYLSSQDKGKRHIEDIAVANAMFAEAFYITVGVL